VFIEIIFKKLRGKKEICLVVENAWNVFCCIGNHKDDRVRIIVKCIGILLNDKEV
jgi:hypothetical protein